MTEFQLGCRVGTAHRCVQIDDVCRARANNGGQCPPYDSNFFQVVVGSENFVDTMPYGKM